MLGLSGCGLYNLQGAYAISNHNGVMIDGMYNYRRFESADYSVERLNIFSGNVGTGYFSTFGDHKTGLYQCYAGGGYGNSSDKIDDAYHNYPEQRAEYINLFVQPGVAYIGKSVAVAFDLRANYVHLYNVNAYLYDKFEFWNTDSKLYMDTTMNFMNIEPAITLKFGSGKVKGFLQLGATIPTINAHSYFIINTASMLAIPLIKFSVGLSYTFGKK